MTTELIFPGVVPGNNGPDGLLRMSVKQKGRLKKSYFYHIRSLTRHRHIGKVKFELVRHSIGPPMDFDNLVSTGKLIADQLKATGVILDDKPAIIVEREYTQTKAMNQQSQFTLIRIVDVAQ